ncbi:MAG: Ig-like domain-containing protein [Elusimicrobiales bacterium]|nr:Ig-like domain-containing protein [Elusimicrobiales bacterium]
MNKTRFLVTLLLLPALAGCGGFKKLKVVDYTDSRVGDLSLTKKVMGKREMLFFSTVKMGMFLDGNIQGVVTDYQGNPIEGVTVKVQPDTGKSKTGAAEVTDGLEAAPEENANAQINLSFAPGISDTMGLYKIHFSLPVVDGEVDVRGKLVYNPGWDQQKINLGKAYEPQMKESPFRMYYNMDTGFLAFAEGVRKVIVQPVGEGRGRLQVLPGSRGPEPVKPAENTPAQPAGGDKAEEDLFKGFDFGQ